MSLRYILLGKLTKGVYYRSDVNLDRAIHWKGSTSRIGDSCLNIQLAVF